MSTFASFARRAASGLVAAQMLLGAVSVSTLALSAPVRAAEAAPVFGSLSPAPQPAPAGSTQPPAAQPSAPQPSPFGSAQPPAAQPAAPQPTPVVAPQPAAPQTPAPQPAPQAPNQAGAPQGITYLAVHGDWQGFTTTIDGRTVVGAMTRMNGGGVAAFMADKAGNLEIVLADPSWRLRDGTTVPVRVMVDGRTYVMTAVAYGNRLEMPRVTQDVLRSFASGSEVQIDAGNGAVVWTLALDGFYDAAQDAAKVIGV